MSDQHCTICVDMHQGAGLVQELGGEGDAKLGGDDGHAALAPPIGFVELLSSLQPLSKARLVYNIAPACLQHHTMTVSQLDWVKDHRTMRSRIHSTACDSTAQRNIAQHCVPHHSLALYKTVEWKVSQQNHQNAT